MAVSGCWVISKIARRVGEVRWLTCVCRLLLTDIALDDAAVARVGPAC